MKIVKLNCTACGSPISIPENLDQLNCSACGSFLQVDRGEGYITLRVLENLAKAIEATGKETTDAIKESSFVTRNELQKLQMQQEIIANQTKLSNIEAEIRTLKRSGVTKINSKELNILYKKQYDLLDRLRNLERKYNAASPNDLEGLIFATQNDISYIDQMIAVLYASFTVNKAESIKSLQKIRSDQMDLLTNLKAREIRKKFPIFQQNLNQVSDTQQVVMNLNSLSEAEVAIKNLPDSPEKNLLIGEINQIRDRLSKDWLWFEQERVAGTLHDIPSISEIDDLERLLSIRDLLYDNIRRLQNENQNSVVQERLKEQKKLKEVLQKRIQKAEKNLRREQTKLAKSAKSAAKNQSVSGKDNRIGLGFGAMIASVGVALGGFGLAVKGMLSSEKGENKLDPENSKVVQHDTLEKDQNPINIKYKSLDKASSKSINKGIIYFILILISFSCIGVLSIVMFEVIFSIETSNATAASIFLVLLISFLIAQKIFISQAFGSVYIKGVLFLPNLYLSHNHPNHGIKSSILVKILVGLFVFISLGLFVITIVAYVPYNDEGSVTTFALVLLLVGLVLDPIISIIAGVRTKVLSADSLE